MGVSVVVTVLNEENTIFSLIDSLRKQTLKFDELIIVDGGSTEKTVGIIKHFQKKDSRIKLLVTKSSRAKGRNLGIEIARNEIIALTDAGCVADKRWLSRLTQPFKNEEVDVVAGFYKMERKSAFQKALGVFLGTMPDEFNAEFLPSARSMAFRKSVWESVGGFPEKAKSTAEDTLFSYNLVKNGFTIVRVKNARVEWRIPNSVGETFDKIFSYAKGDVGTKIWIHPIRGITSHNIKALFKFLRYLTALLFFVFAFEYAILWWILTVSLILYIFWAFKKTFIHFEDLRVGLWGVFFQFLSDFAVMGGFVSGVLKR